MSGKTRLAVGVLSTGLVMGLLADGLLRTGPWGLNFFAWIAMLVAVLLVLSARHGVKLAGGGRWLLIPAILFAATFMLRDSHVLKLLSFIAVAVSMSLATIRARAGSVRVSSIVHYILGFIITSIAACIGVPLLVLGDVEWKEAAGGGRMGRALALARGSLFALPPVIVFAALLMQADPVFDKIIKAVFYIDFTTLLSHLFLIAFFAWVTAGYFRGVLYEWDVPVNVGAPSKTFGIGIIETGIVLGAIDLLFLSFVLVQLRYLFGGHALVQATTGLTYAEYARRGFFELSAVAALVLPLLLGMHWLLRKDNPSHARTFRVLAGFQIVLLFVIIASAAQRMRMYQLEYGLTELRVYTMAFIIWLAVVFLWFAVTVLAGHRERFIFGAMISGFLAIAALQAINPDALIARTNLARAREGRRFDARYVASLDADAVPELLAALPSLTAQDQCTVAERLLKRRSRTELMDWRTWNYARVSADKMTDSASLMLRGMTCPAADVSGVEIVPGS
ncbi:MAG: DUF4153 domain-containing protein [Deltaproteobacteria bacterium]